MTDNRSNRVTPATMPASENTNRSASFIGLEGLENRVLLSASTAAPTIATLSATVAAPSSSSYYTLTAKNVRDNGTVASVKFYHDSNSNGVLDADDRLLGSGRKSVGNNWVLAAVPTGFAQGVNRFFTQATDNDGNVSAVKSTTAKFKLVSIGAIGASSNNSNSRKPLSSASVQTSTSFTLTVSNVVGASSVTFYRDLNNNGKIDSGDTVVGMGTQSGSTWSVTDIAPATTGSAKYIARAADIYGNYSLAKVTTLKVVE